MWIDQLVNFLNFNQTFGDLCHHFLHWLMSSQQSCSEMMSEFWISRYCSYSHECNIIPRSLLASAGQQLLFPTPLRSRYHYFFSQIKLILILTQTDRLFEIHPSSRSSCSVDPSAFTARTGDGKPKPPGTDELFCSNTQYYWLSMNSFNIDEIHKCRAIEMNRRSHLFSVCSVLMQRIRPTDPTGSSGHWNIHGFNDRLWPVTNRVSPAAANQKAWDGFCLLMIGCPSAVQQYLLLKQLWTRCFI